MAVATVAAGFQTVQMHQSEKLDLFMDFVNELIGPETLSGPPTLTVTLNGLAPGAEITIGAASIVGTQVQFRVTTNGPTTKPLIAALYGFECNCLTSTGQIRTMKRYLEIIGSG
jgi:hypothetical protein